ncbi:hypothetical protein RRG08_013474 [Elysia crispata]|uniref:Uncharacterized protein n=1 Tax=Elysia crispata TaxID=231223 RepID=A0AAE1DNW7_9GAST|nr:hypothetical protein RRG08_013474 [Elysia crispata]
MDLFTSFTHSVASNVTIIRMDVETVAAAAITIVEGFHKLGMLLSRMLAIANSIGTSWHQKPSSMCCLQPQLLGISHRGTRAKCLMRTLRLCLIRMLPRKTWTFLSL